MQSYVFDVYNWSARHDDSLLIVRAESMPKAEAKAVRFAAKMRPSARVGYYNEAETARVRNEESSWLRPEAL